MTQPDVATQAPNSAFYTDWRALLRRYGVESAALLFILAVAVALRVTKLATIPRIITADEADNLQTAYHIMAGTGPGFFGFDWKPAPIASLYPLAWTMDLFGDSVADFRLFPVILSLLSLLLFYPLARRAMGPWAALPALLLLATNLSFLHFSRTAWENVNAALFALGACYTTLRALDQRDLSRYWTLWWLLSAVFVALGLYGYFTGRFIFISVALIVLLAVVLRQAPWRPALAGLVLAGAVSALLFAPMARNIIEDWDFFNRRTDNVSVFEVREEEPYFGDTNGWVIAAKNVVRNYQGFVRQDGSEMTRGLWIRYNPPQRAPLDFFATHLFWAGLAIGAYRWRKTFAWWTFFVPLFIAESFSVGTPDVARGVLFVPFYFLFIGLVFDELWKFVRRPIARVALAVGIAASVLFISTVNVVDYFEWQDTPATQRGRLPGIDPCEFGLWSGLARDAARQSEGSFVNPEQFDALRRQLDCSKLIRESLGG